MYGPSTRRLVAHRHMHTDTHMHMHTYANLFHLQNLPALVNKIMHASVKPIDKQYSKVSPTHFFHTSAAGCVRICFPQGLHELQNNMLQLVPELRPSIENIMAEPLVINALINLYTDIGRLPCSNRYLVCISVRVCNSICVKMKCLFFCVYVIVYDLI